MKRKLKPLSPRARARLPLLLCFLTPLLISGIMFAIAGLFPFGDRMILAHDGWHQYYPFFYDFRNKLLHGGSLTYNWSVGMGNGYLSLFAYYLASPLNWLTVLVPAGAMPEFYAFLTVLKLALAGLSFGVFLRTVYRRNNLYLPCFALLFAFCAWAGGYYWNLIWLDTFALLPLLIAGTVSLCRDGRFRLYIGALALSLWCNYYIAFFCCIFVALCFFGYCICKPNGFRGFLRRFLRIGICTLTGVAIAAVILIPTLMAMQTTDSAAKEIPNLLAMNIAEGVSGNVGAEGLWHLLRTETIPGFFSGMSKTLSNLLTGVEPTKMSGLPNISCGMTALILGVYFCLSKRISLREKIINVGLLFFFLLSFLFRILDYVWHGFHFPNMLPYRFSFLFSFVLITMAYRAFLLLDSFRPWHLAVILPVVLGILVNGWYQEQELAALIASPIVAAGVLALLFLLRRIRLSNLRMILCLCMACEAVFSFAMGVAVVSVTSRSTYPEDKKDVQELLEVQSQEPLFYRTEVTTTQTLNDGALNGYHGVSIFTSSANVNFNRFSRSLGLASWPGSNRYVYYESSPFTDTMCGIKYLVDRSGSRYNTDYHTLVNARGETVLLENKSFVSLGFMTHRDLGDYVAEAERYNPIWEQEDMFAAATGITAPVYNHLHHTELTAPQGCTLRATGTSGTQYSYDASDAAEDATFTITYTLPEDGLYLFTSKRPVSDANKVTIRCNGESLFTREIKVRALFSLGNLYMGDKLEFSYTIPKGKEGAISLDVVQQNNAVFDAGLRTLADEPWVLTQWDDTQMSGTVHALQDGLFYTSIPYEPGWEAWVDGNSVPLAETYDPQNPEVRLTDAVIAFPLEAGDHEIVLRYRAPGLTLGLTLSIAGLLVYALLCILLRKKGRLLPDPPRPFVPPTVFFTPPAPAEEETSPEEAPPWPEEEAPQ